MAVKRKVTRQPSTAKNRQTAVKDDEPWTVADLNQERKEKQKKEDFMLIQRAIEGEQKAFTELMRRYEQPIFNLMYKMVHSTEEAQDLVQEAFMKAFTSLAHFNYEFAFSTWLYKIASNNCIDHLRKKKLQTFSIDTPVVYKGEEFSYEIPDLTYYPDIEMIRRERSALIRKAIDSLPEIYREIIRLRHSEELSYEEIADMLHIPIGTVKARLFRAREMLNHYLKDKLDKG